MQRDDTVNARSDAGSGKLPDRGFGSRYRRLAKTVRGANARLFSAKAQSGVWNWKMSALVLAGLCAVFVVHFFDGAVIEAARASRSVLISWLAAITAAGKFQWYMFPALAVLVFVASADWASRDRRGRGRLSLLYAQSAFALGALLITFVSNNLVKVIIGRARPKFLEEHGSAYFQPFSVGYDFASFPSGHATACGTVAAILAIWFPRWTVPALLAFAILAVSRIAVSAHYPSDVTAGFFVGFLVTVFIARWLAVRRLGFRLEAGRLLPRLRHTQAMRATPSK